MTDFLMPGRLTAESEFNNVPAGVNGACGVEAIASALRTLHQSDAYTVAKCFADIHAWGLCAANGVMNTDQIKAACVKYGLIIHEAGNENLLTFSASFFDPTPKGCVIFFYENGQSLVDYISHDGMDASNLHGHFNTADGYNDGGESIRAGRVLPQVFWVADGDNNMQNPIINGSRVHRGLNTSLVFYPNSDLTQAQINWVLGVSLSTPPVVPSKTIAVNLRQPYSLDEIDKASTKDIEWLKSWNKHLSTLPGYTNTALPLPAGSPVNIPYRD